MSTFGIDYAWGGPPSTAAMSSAGVKFACRYLSHSASKNLTAAEARKLSDAGIWIVVVWETTAQRALGGRTAGIADAMDAQVQAQACGMPPGRPIYFAVDWDATSGQQAAINAYLAGAASVLGPSRVGIYGGYGPVKRALDGGHARWAWQTYAWSGGQWDSRAQVQQYSNSHTLGGVDCDYDRAMTSDYGQWRIGATPSPQHQEEDVYGGQIPAGKGQQVNVSFPRGSLKAFGLVQDNSLVIDGVIAAEPQAQVRYAIHRADGSWQTGTATVGSADGGKDHSPKTVVQFTPADKVDYVSFVRLDAGARPVGWDMS
jgi:hypothetical protein